MSGTAQKEEKTTQKTAQKEERINALLEWYQRRIEWNKSKQTECVYWSFWGDLQYELLPCLPEERISKKSKELIHVLSRRFDKVQSCYYNKEGHSGWVSSPVSGKNIGKKQWLQIITNSKLKNRNRFKSIEVKGGFIESSLEMYVDDFRKAVRQEPQKMIGLVLEHRDKVLSVFIDALFSGVELSEGLNEIEPKMIEKMFYLFPCDLKTHRAAYFCGIIEKMNSVVWSEEVLNQLKHIALYHENPALDKPNVTSPEDKKMKSCQMLSSNALNCIRGQAARAIENLLWEDDKKFLQEIVGSKVSKKIVWSFIHYLEENALSIVDYADIIIRLCENILWMEMGELRNQWGIENKLSKLIISLYDETSNSEKNTDKQIAEKCLELWDVMFERQLGSVREISRKLMER